LRLVPDGRPLILNRDLRASDVPDIPAAALDPPEGGHAAAWARIWRFALTFQPDAYEKATGIRLDESAVLAETRSRLERGDLETSHLRELRTAL
jgi:hypothetical protein